MNFAKVLEGAWRVFACLLSTAVIASATMSPCLLKASADADVWDGSVATGFAGGDGTSAATAYAISNGAQLAYLAQQVNNGTDYSGKYLKLTANITLNATLSGGNLNVWTSIGTVQFPFNGNFDGAGYTVSGIYINNSNYYQGLFCNIGSSGTVKNVSVANSSINGAGKIGGVAGGNNGTIDNCYNAADISGSANNFGGVAGENDGTIENCHNTGTVSGPGLIGGMVGTNEGTVENCSNAGTVSCSGSGYPYSYGGVVGENDGTIENCCNTGAVSGSTNVGGVAGTCSSGNRSCIIENCYNTGAVSGSGNCLGGVAGENESCNGNSSTIENCYNTGAVSGSGDSLGGVAGSNTSIIQYCYNSGTISGSTFDTGGVVGQNSSFNNINGTIEYCYNVGTVTGSNCVGGVAGENIYGGAETGCFYDKQMCAAKGVNGSDTADASGKTTADMTGTGLKTGDTGVGWTAANWSFAEGLYPRLAGEGMGGTSASYVSASPVYLADGDRAVNVTKNFTLSTDNNVVWTSGDAGIVTVNGGTATMGKNSSVTLTASLGSVSRAVKLLNRHHRRALLQPK